MRGLRIKKVADRYDVTPMTIRRWIAAGRFPQGLKLGPGTRVWFEDELLEFENRQSSREPRQSA